MGEVIESIWYGREQPWWGKALGLGLAPLSWAYRASQAVHSSRVRPQRVDRPVVSVGNLTVGGSGKTPLVMELVRLLETQGQRVAVVARGYGRQSRGTRLVWSPGGRSPDPATSGDEPALVAARCPQATVVVGEDRLDAARLALETCRPDWIVCDDAFQHRRLARDLDLVAIHARHGFGNRRLLPAGPLREPVSALARAGLVVFAHMEDQTLADLRSRWDLPADLVAVGCRFEPDCLVAGPQLTALAGSPPRRVVAACGIAHPEGFAANLRRFGLEVAELIGLGDHRRWSERDLEGLVRRLEVCRAEAIAVTEKDLVKLSRLTERAPLVALRLRARWVDGASQDRIEQALADARAGVRKGRS